MEKGAGDGGSPHGEMDPTLDRVARLPVREHTIRLVADVRKVHRKALPGRFCRSILRYLPVFADPQPTVF
jgi:hypothetical protein